MPVKLIALLAKRRDLERSAFVAWYEEYHVPTILEVMPGIIDYRRNFLPETTAGIDAVTEICFADKASYDAAMAAVCSPAASARIERDQQMLFDPEGIRTSLVDERGGPCLPLRFGPGERLLL